MPSLSSKYPPTWRQDTLKPEAKCAKEITRNTFKAGLSLNPTAKEAVVKKEMHGI